MNDDKVLDLNKTKKRRRRDKNCSSCAHLMVIRKDHANVLTDCSKNNYLDDWCTEKNEKCPDYTYIDKDKMQAKWDV